MKKLLSILILVILIAGCGKKEISKTVESKFLFGTYIEIIVYDDDTQKANNAITSAFNEISRIDKEFNSKTPGSIIYRLNSGEISSVKLTPEGIYLIKNIQKIYKVSNKMYDITITPLLDAWGFENPESATMPTKNEIENALKKVDFEKIKLNKNILSYSGVQIDTGSFLKGYAILRAKKIMEQMGVKSALITSVSSIATIGTKPNGKDWRIGVENPQNPKEIMGIVELNGESMGVSGDYQTYVEIEGKRYHHILNKHTGFPIGDKKMVVVISDNAFLCDMYSTAFFLMPKDEIFKFAKIHNLKVLIVDNNMKIYRTPNFNMISK